jgi:hypothetical protein
MAVRTDPISGFQHDDFERQRPSAYDDSGTVAQRQTFLALEAMRARGATDDEIRDARARLVHG